MESGRVGTNLEKTNFLIEFLGVNFRMFNTCINVIIISIILVVVAVVVETEIVPNVMPKKHVKAIRD